MCVDHASRTSQLDWVIAAEAEGKAQALRFGWYYDAAPTRHREDAFDFGKELHKLHAKAYIAPLDSNIMTFSPC